MSKTWRTTQVIDFIEDYYAARETDELIENAYERAYRAQCQRELELWEKRRNSNIRSSPRA